MTGIGRINSLYRSRKIKKNKNKRKEFYITGEIAGAMLNEQLEEPSFEVKPVTEPYRKTKTETMEDISSDIQYENEERQEQREYEQAPVEHTPLSIEEQESEQILREILAPIQENLHKKEPFVSAQHQNNIDRALVEALEQSQLEEELQRQKTDKDSSFNNGQKKLSTDRYYPKVETIHESPDHTNDVLSSLGINQILDEVKQIKELYGEQNNSEPFPHTLPSDSTNDNDEMNSRIFQKKVNDILGQIPNIEDLKEPQNNVHVEKLWTRKRNYDRSKTVDEWRAKLGLKNFDDI